MEPRRKMSMTSTVVLLLYFTTENVLSDLEVIAFTTWRSKMSSGIDNPKQNQHHLAHLAKGDEVSLEEMQDRFNIAAAAAAAAVDLVPSLYLAKEIGEINEKTNGLNEENNRLQEKIKTLKRENEALKEKVKEMENQNQKHEKTIGSLEASYDKLQKELAKVKVDKDRLRIEIEEKTSKFSTENKILAEKLEALTNDFEEVERENNELKRRLEQLTNSNNSLKQTVDLVKIENQELKDEIGNLKADHKEFREKFECKETRLALGQVAWLLEAEIWKAVLPDEKMGTTGILKSMKHWLKKNSSNDKGKEAQKRWDDLKGKLNWDEDDHKLALSLLKKLRIVDAHPPKVDLEQARKQLNEGGYIADTDKKSCEEIIDMLVTARNLNNSK